MELYLFLDCDGVVATAERIEEKEWCLVDHRQLLLGKILDATGAKIVLSSSWRKNTLEETIEKMNRKGFFYTNKIVGVTIRAKMYIDRSTKIHLSIPRGVEIAQWLDTHVHSDNGKNFVRKQIGVDYNYVILDDNGGMLLSQKDHFVQTQSTGITQEDVDKAIGILSQKKSV